MKSLRNGPSNSQAYSSSMLVLDSASVLRQTRRKSTAPAKPLPTMKSAVFDSDASLAMASSLAFAGRLAVDVDRGLAGRAVHLGDHVMPLAVVDFDRRGHRALAPPA